MGGGSVLGKKTSLGFVRPPEERKQLHSLICCAQVQPDRPGMKTKADGTIYNLVRL